MFEVFECVLQLGACSQNKGSRCTLPYNNEHFDSKKIEIGSVSRLGSVRKGGDVSNSISFESLWKSNLYSKVQHANYHTIMNIKT